MRVKYLISILSVIFSLKLAAQVTLNPVFATQNDTVTIVFDATKGNAALVNLGPPEVYIHTGLITNLSSSGTNWQHVQGVWGTDDLPRKMTYLGSNKYSIKIYIPTFYSISAPEKATKIACVFRNRAGDKVGRSADGSDIFVDLYPPGLKVAFTAPAAIPGIFNKTDTITLQMLSSESSHLSLFENGSFVDSTKGQSWEFNYYGKSPGSYQYVVTATQGSETTSDTLTLVVNSDVVTEALPAGMQDGVNYLSDTSVLLSLYAPGKNFVYAFGDFSNWQLLPKYFMKRTPDGNRWWTVVSGLTAAKQYAYQFAVDGVLKIADPLSELVLDPWNDQYVKKSDFPNLPAYPAGKTTGIVSVIHPGKTAFAWKHDNFKITDANKLNIYELHVRDFIADHRFETLLDTLDYLQNLGVTAIELMPVSEFEGNSSWGYNISYHMALDKYYGNENQLKAFIDACHARGIAVLHDVVLNHTFGQSSLCQLYWNITQNRPEDNNPWLNPVAKHDFNVGYDFNHESDATRTYTDRVLKHWLTEFHFDGFRFDLSKGFTQKNTLGNSGAMAQYDASRIAIWKRIRDAIRSYDADAMLILEHFADNAEETELVAEGFYIWGNSSYDYAQASMGYASDVSWSSYKKRNWSKPNLVGYMESHDEERMMYKNLTFGNTNGSYSTKVLATGLKRCEMAAVTFLSIPGPKMIWQFGELGYDVNIDFNGRTGEKPIRWNYNTNPERLRLKKVYATMFDLRNRYPVFHTDTAVLDLSGTVKKSSLSFKGHFVVTVANTDVKSVNTNLSFQDTGVWYEVFTGDSIRLNSKSIAATLAAGEYRLYSNVRMTQPVFTNALDPLDKNPSLGLYPNPAQTKVWYLLPNVPSSSLELKVFTASGKLIYSESGKLSGFLDVSAWTPGVYQVQLLGGGFSHTGKLWVNP
jgi:hypothetical protein